MEITIKISEEVLTSAMENALKTTIAGEIHRYTQQIAAEKVRGLKSEIESAVDIFLAKRLTKENLKSMINQEAIQVIASLIRRSADEE